MHMKKYTIKIEGMMCGMCEAHVCDIIRKSVPSAKRVKATRIKKEASFISATEINENELKKAILETGYTVGYINVEPYKGFFNR